MPSEVQILKESKARFEGVIFNQTADLGTNKSTSCKVIDEATGEVIAQSGGGGGESDYTAYTLTVTAVGVSADEVVNMYGPFLIQGTVGGKLPLNSPASNIPLTVVASVGDTEEDTSGACIIIEYDGDLELETTTESTVFIEENNVHVVGNGDLTITIK